MHHALTYLSLREKGCPKGDAIQFSSKQRCAIDTTQKFDGPSTSRIIQRVDNRSEGVVRKGWQFHSPQYKLGREYNGYVSKENGGEYEGLIKQFTEFSKYFKFESGEVVKEIRFEHVRPPRGCNGTSGRETPFKAIHFKEQPVKRPSKGQYKPFTKNVASKKLLRPKATGPKTRDKAEYMVHSPCSKFEIRSIQPTPAPTQTTN